ncbi:MAG: radical SAM protein, partial [Candidatus Promineifilaceae bacterium]|nr:radical SAM protein [Candidatus Promineifilaceae bacterium]
MRRLRILLLSNYESGHQPLRVAWPLAFLEQAGFSVRALDLSLTELSHDAVRVADLVGLAVPMHTALRLGVAAAEEVRRVNSGAHICFFGLYAWLNAAYLLNGSDGQPLADSVMAGEFEAGLVKLAERLADQKPVDGLPGVRTRAAEQGPLRERLQFPLPKRSSLPDLSRYAHLVENGSNRVAGYVEATRGCLHTCRHCPVVPVYQGRFFVVSPETVMADIDQQVEAGARHITFGDPDFLNGPGHALRVARMLHARHPNVTFDFTTKVEHLLERAELLPELRALGAAFVVSAFESTSDLVLQKLRKGHSAADLDR